MSWVRLLEEKSALANALDLVGDHWTLMIVKGCLGGYRRFNQMENHLGINRNLLKSKLEKLVASGVLDKKPYKENAKHYAYFPTEMCYDLQPIIVGLAAWGQKYLTKEHTPIQNVHNNCGGPLNVSLYCEDCHSSVAPVDVVLKLNLGAGGISEKIVSVSQ